ncbi:G5 domain-containing protein [Oscillospiraceae bacterium MB08-C2-2]|nr:G5 domain-containing protein [Oscillospiraceae bacterium MB08-C2-2]
MNSLIEGQQALRRNHLGRPFALLALLGALICGMTLTAFADSDTFSVHVVADGETSTILMSTGDTVSDALYKAKVFVETEDLFEPALDTRLKEDDVVTVRRVTHEVWVDEETIAHEVKTVPSGDLPRGQRKVTKEGSDGKRVRTYEMKLIDGEVVEEKLVEEVVQSKPVTEEVTLGMGSHPVSPLNFEVDFDDNVEPVSYKSVIRGTKSTAYYAPAGSKTASGRDAMVGHVAVNPNVIPYGSKLFIQASDGSFIYGYAVAADTGTSLLNGTVGIDLFYGTYGECVSHGAQNVDVFILE